MKRLTSLLALTICALLFGQAMYQTAFAEEYLCREYSIEVPEGYNVDSETVAHYTSFIKGAVNIGISVHENENNENVADFNENDINKVCDDTLDILNEQAGEGIKVILKEKTTISDNKYAALHIIYEGGTNSDSDVYMDEYIVTTSNYKYTLVFSADKASDLSGSEITNMLNSFQVNQDGIEAAPKINLGITPILIIIILGLATVISGIVTVVIIINNSKK